MRKGHLFLAIGVLLMSSVPAAAQFQNLKISLPFGFQIGDQTFEAGTYTFTQETRNDKMIVQGKKGRELVVTTALPPESVADKAHTTLVFHRDGDKYFLNELWTRHLGFAMPTSAAEKEAVAAGKEVREVKVNVKM